jgi:putative ABC transport system permease protein
VVGIAGDVSMYNWWDGIDYSAVYRPLRQAPTGSGAQIVVRTRDDPASAAAAIRAAIRSAEPSMAIHQLRTMRQGIEESGFVLNYLALLMVICGAIAVALSVAGIYSVMAYAMSQRTHEIGIRLALGATPRDVLYAMLRQAGTLTAIGLGIGVVLAAVFGRLLASALSV